MLQILDNGDREHSKFLVRKQPEDNSFQDFSGAVQFVQDLDEVFVVFQELVKIIHETYGTTKFSIDIEESCYNVETHPKEAG